MISVVLSDEVVGLLRQLHNDLSGEVAIGSFDYYGNFDQHDCSQEIWALGEAVSAIDSASAKNDGAGGSAGDARPDAINTTEQEES